MRVVHGGIAELYQDFIGFISGEEGKGYRLKNLDNPEELFSIPALSEFTLSGLKGREKTLEELEYYVKDGITAGGTYIFAVNGGFGVGKSKFLQGVGERKEIPESLAKSLDGYLPLAITWGSFSSTSSQSFYFDVAMRLFYS